MAFFKSMPERTERMSTLRPGGQEDLFSQLLAAIGGTGAGGAFGDVSDYYRGLMGGEGAEEFEAPLRRQFSEDIMPGIAEQFAGLGSGGLSSGNFVQETGRAGTDLAERLGSIRAGLREKGAAGLSGLAQGALSPVDELQFRPRQPSLFENFMGGAGGGLGKGIGMAAGGPVGTGMGSLFDSFMKKGGGI